VRRHLYAPSSITPHGYIKYCMSYWIVTDMLAKTSRAPPENRTRVSEMSPLRPVLLYTTRLHQILYVLPDRYRHVSEDFQGLTRESNSRQWDVTFTPRPPLHHTVTSSTVCLTGSLQTCQWRLPGPHPRIELASLRWDFLVYTASKTRFLYCAVAYQDHAEVTC